MSDIIDRAVTINFDGIEYDLIFTLNVDEQVFEVYETPKALVNALFRQGEAKRTKAIKVALEALINQAVRIHNKTKEPKLQPITQDDIGEKLIPEDKPIMAGIIMEAFYRSLPGWNKKGNPETEEETAEKNG